MPAPEVYLERLEGGGGWWETPEASGQQWPSPGTPVRKDNTRSGNTPVREDDTRSDNIHSVHDIDTGRSRCLVQLQRDTDNESEQWFMGGRGHGITQTPEGHREWVCGGGGGYYDVNHDGVVIRVFHFGHHVWLLTVLYWQSYQYPPPPTHTHTHFWRSSLWYCPPEHLILSRSVAAAPPPPPPPPPPWSWLSGQGGRRAGGGGGCRWFIPQMTITHDDDWPHTQRVAKFILHPPAALSLFNQRVIVNTFSGDYYLVQELGQVESRKPPGPRCSEVPLPKPPSLRAPSHSHHLLTNSHPKIDF